MQEEGLIMSAKKLSKIDEEIQRKRAAIEELQNQLKNAEKTKKVALRQEREHLTYAIGRIILNKKSILAKYPQLLLDIYDEMMKRDQIKMVKAELISEDEAQLRKENKQECIDSSQSLQESELSEKDKEDLDIALSVPTPKIYGRAGEQHVYISANKKKYISDELSAHLQKNEGFRV